MFKTFQVSVVPEDENLPETLVELSEDTQNFDGSVVVTALTSVEIDFVYPLNRPFKVMVSNSTGFTVADIVAAARENYQRVALQEDAFWGHTLEELCLLDFTLEGNQVTLAVEAVC